VILNDAFDTAYEIIEEMMLHGITSYRLQVTRENENLIRQIIKATRVFRSFRYSYIGVIGGKRWFVLRDHSVDITGPAPAGELIFVDFKAKKRMAKAV